MALDWFTLEMCIAVCIFDLYHMLFDDRVGQRIFHFVFSIVWGVLSYLMINVLL